LVGGKSEGQLRRIHQKGEAEGEVLCISGTEDGLPPNLDRSEVKPTTCAVKNWRVSLFVFITQFRQIFRHVALSMFPKWSDRDFSASISKTS
jgi:hypothetical protein